MYWQKSRQYITYFYLDVINCCSLFFLDVSEPQKYTHLKLIELPLNCFVTCRKMNHPVVVGILMILTEKSLKCSKMKWWPGLMPSGFANKSETHAKNGYSCDRDNRRRPPIEDVSKTAKQKTLSQSLRFLHQLPAEMCTKLQDRAFHIVFSTKWPTTLIGSSRGIVCSALKKTTPLHPKPPRYALPSRRQFRSDE